jgi:hypothetical protein
MTDKSLEEQFVADEQDRLRRAFVAWFNALSPAEAQNLHRGLGLMVTDERIRVTAESITVCVYSGLRGEALFQVLVDHLRAVSGRPDDEPMEMSAAARVLLSKEDSR